MYADYAYYASEYLLGRTPAVPEKEYPYWEKQARAVVDQWTHNRIKEDARLNSDEVKECVCALTEHFYNADRLNQSGQTPGVIASYSNDGESATYNVSDSAYTESGSKEKVKRLIYQYLAITGLLYAGVDK